MGKPSASLAQAICRVVADFTSTDFQALGVMPEDYALAAGNTVWLAPHRARVERVLEALLYGTSDLMGYSRITLPAEFVAVVIGSFVSPVNARTACYWLSERKLGGVAANELAYEQGGVDPVTVQKLWAVVVMLLEGDHTTEARKAYESRIEKRLRDAAGITSEAA